LQKTLDTQGIEIVENQKESVIGRRALADKTKGMHSFFSERLWGQSLSPIKDFKKIPDTEKLNVFKGLLKGASGVS